MTDEEFELVPLSPIRRLEKRLERIEGSGMSADLLKELMEVVKTNQQVVDDVVRINSQMIGKISDLSIAVGELTSRMNDFMNRIEVSGEEKPPQKENSENKEEEARLNERLSKLEKRINMMLVAMTKTRPKPAVQQPMQRVPRMMGRPIP